MYCTFFALYVDGCVVWNLQRSKVNVLRDAAGISIILIWRDREAERVPVADDFLRAINISECLLPPTSTCDDSILRPVVDTKGDSN